MALSNCEYNKAKLKHELGCLTWFVKNHALNDAEKEGLSELKSFLKKLHDDLDHLTKELKKLD